MVNNAAKHPSIDALVNWARQKFLSELEEQEKLRIKRIRECGLSRDENRIYRSIEAIIALNDDIFNSYKIYENQIIRLPHTDIKVTPSKKKSSPPTTTLALDKKKRSADTENVKWYQVRGGENLQQIARKFNTSVKKRRTLKWL